MSKLVFCLMGPTASGKTDLAFKLCEKLPLEIISVDSALIYREMNIGTAKPSTQELQQFPHHLIDILNPPETYSAAQFCDAVENLVRLIYAKGRYPLLVGGTMMYFNALQQGLANLPTADENIRTQLLQQAEKLGWPHLHEELKQLDPLTASVVHPHDAQRIQRALEIYYSTGRTLSSFKAEQDSEAKYQFINLGLFPENRHWLHDRIEQRLTHMIAQGFIDEVHQLLDKWQLTLNNPSLRCVGYRQAYAFLQGEYSKEEFFAKALAATRQLAKRQLTWLRHWPKITYFDSENAQTQEKSIAIITKIVDNLHHY